jgi:hypothetical protein
MCSPQLAGTFLQIAGGVAGAENARQEAQSNKDYFDYLAANEEKKSGYVQEAAGRQTKQLRANVSALEGTQAVNQAASGVGGGSVTSENIAMDTFRKEKLDEMAIRYNADMESFGNKNKAREYRMAGDNAIEAGKVKANMSYLNTATSVANTWYQSNKKES